MIDQKEIWSSKFGQEYTERNIFAPSDLDDFYEKEYGVSRIMMNEEFLASCIEKDAKILEIGCNVGNQLRLLQDMGYKNLYGIELQDYAVQRAKELTSGVNIIKGVGDDIPFKDDYFDLVFTSGVLIHIPPKLLKKVMSEMVRVSKRYIWGFEYYSDEYEEINYREKESLLWKGDFCNAYIQNFDIKLLKRKKFKYLNTENEDEMFLLEKVR